MAKFNFVLLSEGKHRKAVFWVSAFTSVPVEIRFMVYGPSE